MPIFELTSLGADGSVTGLTAGNIAVPTGADGLDHQLTNNSNVTLSVSFIATTGGNAVSTNLVDDEDNTIRSLGVGEVFTIESGSSLRFNSTRLGTTGTSNIRVSSVENSHGTHSGGGNGDLVHSTI